MLRDEIGDELEAAKRRDNVLTVLLVVGLVAVMGAVMIRNRAGRAARKERDAAKVMTFAGREVRPPALWNRSPEQSTADTLTLLPEDGGLPGRSITLADERSHPEISTQFAADVKQLKQAVVAGPTQLDIYHDASVDATGTMCIRNDLGGLPRRVKIDCMASDGQFKLTLMGTDRDLRALDTLIEQLGVFGN